MIFQRFRSPFNALHVEKSSNRAKNYEEKSLGQLAFNPFLHCGVPETQVLDTRPASNCTTYLDFGHTTKRLFIKKVPIH